MVDSNRKDFKYKREWRREQERKEFEKYNIQDGFLILMTGCAIAFMSILTHGVKFPIGSEPIPNIAPYMAGIVVLTVINAVGIMLTKKKRKFGLGSLIELGTILAFIWWTYYNHTSLMG